MINCFLDDYKTISIKKSALGHHSPALLINNEEREYDTSFLGDDFLIILKEDFNEENNYEVLLDKKRYPLIPRFIFHTRQFDEEYCPDVKTLGSFIKESKHLFRNKETLFRLWAPLSKKAYVYIDDKEYEMIYKGKGIYERVFNGSLEGHLYSFGVLREKLYCFSDPFSYLDKDENHSFVINPEYLINKERFKPKDKKTVIYETSIRDFSSDERMPFKFKKKFLAFSESGLTYENEPVGLDYLKDLGVSHIQLMPVFAFNIDKTDYNWGYNPMAYNSLHQDYLVSKEANGLNELRILCDTLHKNDLKVTLDVVFNHSFNDKTFNLSKMLPYYCYRYYKNGKLGNASGCGNEIRSESLFVREYLKMLCERFIKVFDIDGLRFDLMGIIDKQTMLEIRDVCLSLKKDFLIYGEGWNMGDIVSFEDKAIMENAKEMENIAFFNYHFRETVRGRDINDRRAYMLGDLSLKEELFKVLNHSYDYGFEINQTINYTECHDNYTVFDKVSNCTSHKSLIDKVCRLAMGLILVSKGLPFIHSGQEFLRTKNGIDNTYNLPDRINKLDWVRKNEELNNVNYVKELIELRNSLDDLTDDNLPYCYDYYEVLVYGNEKTKVFINCCSFDHIYEDGKTYQILFDGFKRTDYEDDGFKVPAFALVIAKEK